jgi:phage terminase large subunit
LFQQFIDIIKTEKLEDYFIFTTSPYKIKYKGNNNVLLFLGLDSERIGSTSGITSTWVDESHFITEEDWINLVGSLGRAKNPKNKFQFILSFNPFGGTRHWINKRFFITNEWKAKIYKTIYKDNEWIADDYEQVLDASKHNHAYYMAAKYGEFANQTDTQIFRNFYIYSTALHSSFSSDVNAYKPIIGLDFGHRHAAAAVLTATIGDTLLVFDEIYHTGLTTQQFINKILDKRWDKSWTYYCDSANPDKILELQQNGFNAVGVKKGPGSVAYSIDVLLRHQILIMPKCVNLLDEMYNYSYKFNEKTSEIFNVPADHQQDDAVDALRYSIEGYMDLQPETKAVMALF